MELLEHGQRFKSYIEANIRRVVAGKPSCDVEFRCYDKESKHGLRVGVSMRPRERQMNGAEALIQAKLVDAWMRADDLVVSSPYPEEETKRILLDGELEAVVLAVQDTSYTPRATDFREYEGV